MLAPWKQSYHQPREHIKKQRYYFANKGLSSHSYCFPSSHVWMWELDYKESWALKNWCFCTVLLEKTLESPLDCKEIKPANPKENQSWVFIGSTDAEAETPILWPPDMKNQFIWKDPDAGKDYRWKKKGTTEDEMVGCYHRLHEHEFEQALGAGGGQGSLVCCSPWGCKIKSDWATKLKMQLGCKSESLSHLRLFVTPWTVTHQAPVHGILQARILEQVAFSFSRGSSWPRDWIQVSHISGRLFTNWSTRAISWEGVKQREHDFS